MSKARAAIGAVTAAGLLAVPAVLLTATGSSHRTSDPSLVQVCLTVTPKSISVSVNGITIGNTVAGVDRTCVGV